MNYVLEEKYHYYIYESHPVLLEHPLKVEMEQ